MIIAYLHIELEADLTEQELDLRSLVVDVPAGLDPDGVEELLGHVADAADLPDAEAGDEVLDVLLLGEDLMVADESFFKKINKFPIKYIRIY